MGNYAIVKNGVVENVIVSEAPFAVRIGAVLLPEGFGMGDKFDGRAWQKALPSQPPEVIANESEIDILRRQVEELSAKINEMEGDSVLKQEVATIKETVLELIETSGGDR